MADSSPAARLIERGTFAFQKLVHKYRAGGLGGACEWLVSRSRALLYLRENHVILVKDLRDEYPAERPSSVVVRKLDAADVEALFAFSKKYHSPWTTRHFSEFLDSGYEALIGFDDGRPIGHLWWTAGTSAVEHPDVVLHDIPVRDGDVYAFWYFIAPEYRGRGTAQAFLAAIHLELAKLGYERLLGFVIEDNVPARWAFAVAGYETRERVTVRAFMSLVWFARKGLFIRNLRGRSIGRHLVARLPAPASDGKAAGDERAQEREPGDAVLARCSGEPERLEKAGLVDADAG